jgi:thiol-disulfide isomerase/thioredoxin
MAQRQQRELSAADKIMMDQKNAFLAGMGDVMEKLEQYNKLYYQTSNRDSVSRLMEPYRKIYLERMTDYVKKYPSTALAANFLCMNTGRMTLEQLKEAYNKLDETARQTSAGKEIAAEIATLDRVAPGNPAPEIAKNDLVTGKPFALSSLKGKVVLLDFWASWCVPCRKSNPHVKALYEKYRKKGFDVVYVADNDSRPEEALKAIDQDGIRKYHHVLRGLKTLKDANGKMTGYDKSEDVSEQYAIHFLPTKYLIDREGKIIGKVTDEELDAKLKEIFGF